MVAFILSLFTIGTIWFYLLLSISIISIIFYIIEGDKDLESTLPSTTLLFFITAAIIGFSNFSILQTIYDYVTINPFYTIGLVICYYIIGILWSLYKWRSFVKKYVAKYNSAIENNLKNSLNGTYRPDLKYYKSMIFSWITYWVFSIIATAISEYILNLKEFIFDKTSKFYNAITDSIYDSVVKEINEKNDLDKSTKTKNK